MDVCKFQASLVYRVNPRPAKAMQKCVLSYPLSVGALTIQPAPKAQPPRHPPLQTVF